MQRAWGDGTSRVVNGAKWEERLEWFEEKRSEGDNGRKKANRVNI
jgi:hypothetical protein